MLVAGQSVLISGTDYKFYGYEMSHRVKADLLKYYFQMAIPKC